MKKMFLVALSALLMIPSAFAEQASIEQAQQLEILNYEESQARINGGDLFLGFVGGLIVGAIAHDMIDRDHSRRDYRGDVVCFAKDGRDRTYRARANRARVAQQKALNKCYRFASWCRPAGCISSGW